MIRNTILALCSLLAACGLVECGLRATHAFNAHFAWTEPDPLIGFRSTPGRTSWSFGENDHPVAGRINAMGWRDRERTRDKPAGTIRIAVLGDSYVEAMQVEIDSTFVAVAERSANARDSGRYEFMNFGRSGMGPAEEYIVLERDVLPCRPDVVVLLFTPHNDIADVNRFTSYTSRRPFFVADVRDSLVLDTSFRSSAGYRLRELLNPLKQKSALISLLSWRYNVWRAKPPSSQPQRVPTRLTSEQTLLTAHPDSLYAANYALAKRAVIEMAKMCTRDGVAWVLASAPLVYEDHAIAALRSIDSTFDPNFFDRDLSAMADTCGFAFVRLTDGFQAESRRSGERLHWAHWNYPGHRLVGLLLAARVLALDSTSDGSSN